jgi:prepilin-type N-terminal cleavage/methylation domain-containing protein
VEGLLRKGFTLVETVFSLSLIALVIMMVFNLFPSSSMAVHRSKQELHAASLAQARLEELRSQPFPQLLPGASPLPVVELDGVKYARRQEIARKNDRLTDLKVTVTWTDGRRDHTLTQEAYVARLPR